MKRKRILHIIKSLGRGGAERLLVSTIRMHSKEFEFDVIFFLSKRNQLQKDLEALGCRVTCLNSSNIFQILLKLPALSGIIKKQHYDLIHAHLPWAGIMARMAGKITDVPVVYTEHNIFRHYNQVTRFFSKLTFSWQACVIAVSDEVASVVLEVVKPAVRVKTIRNGVDTMEFKKGNFQVEELKKKLALPADAVIIGNVSSIRPQKRIDRWISIAKKISNQTPNVFFLVVGGGATKDELEVMANVEVGEDKVLFTGQSSEPEQWMACMDIYLMSSDFEGLPVALLEAMSMECVPVVTSVGGIPTVLEDEKNGYLFKPEDEETAVKRIIELIQQPERISRMGLEARKSVAEHYGIERMVRELEEVYEDVLSNRQLQKHLDEK